ncbi:hypothetical protein BFF94_003500 [Burkholderia catarinensis]|nr:hypothetical protein BFF94_003500 [Burkholderia catarinensis]
MTDLAQPAGGGHQILDFGESGIGGHQEAPAVCLRTAGGRVRESEPLYRADIGSIRCGIFHRDKVF